MNWLSSNWIWLVLIGGMLWMHLGMHRGHSMHRRPPQSGHKEHGQDDSATDSKRADESPVHYEKIDD